MTKSKQTKRPNDRFVNNWPRARGWRLTGKTVCCGWLPARDGMSITLCCVAGEFILTSKPCLHPPHNRANKHTRGEIKICATFVSFTIPYSSQFRGVILNHFHTITQNMATIRWANCFPPTITASLPKKLASSHYHSDLTDDEAYCDHHSWGRHQAVEVTRVSTPPSFPSLTESWKEKAVMHIVFSSQPSRSLN